MGFTPQQVNQMSMWEFMAAAEGFATAHEVETPGRMSADEVEDVWNWMQEKTKRM